jgi:hypothetical protein
MVELSATSPATLTKALLRATHQLGLAADLGALLATPASEAAALQAGARTLDPQRDEWARALQLVGLFRSLISLVGTPERARDWLNSPNQALGATPIEVLRTHDAERVFRYLAAVQKHELRLPPSSRRDH